ncbi:MAG TPA: hypothetical protein VNN08_03390 [Thermoanaerobaculia bacterium]|nr:hypothetical protein [Thermoanaerobaculia bacterium]
MFHRVTILFAILILVSSMSFALPSGCANFLCVDNGVDSQYCIRPITSGGGTMFGCTTIWQCNGVGYCVSYCSSTYCYFV